MRINRAFIGSTLAFCSLVHAQSTREWDGAYKKFSGRYLVYSGELGEQKPSTQQERKASFMVEGRLAKEMFNALGPDLKDACGTSSGARVRQKGDLDCTFDKSDPNPYTCHFGIDLRKGKSIGGSIC